MFARNNNGLQLLWISRIRNHDSIASGIQSSIGNTKNNSRECKFQGTIWYERCFDSEVYDLFNFNK